MNNCAHSRVYIILHRNLSPFKLLRMTVKLLLVSYFKIRYFVSYVHSIKSFMYFFEHRKLEKCIYSF